MPETPNVSSHRLQKLARERFGLDAFRPQQEAVVQLLLTGNDVLAVMPPGSGQSAIYQISGLLLRGPTIVVSPQIAQQKEPIDGELQIVPAAGSNSSLSSAERRSLLRRVGKGMLEFIFISPEQCRRPELLEQLIAAKPSLFVVDDAHCISEWGHDFRTEFGQLGELVAALGHPRVLALTATAGPNVRDDIVQRLGMRKPRVVAWGLDRPNIRLEVEACRDENAKSRSLLSRVRKLDRPGIIYVATRAHAEQIATLLRDENLPASAAHAGMTAPERVALHDAFLHDGGILVAANALGTDLDKPDVRFVIHYDVPGSLESYYQELGRAGRDGGSAVGVLLYRPADVGRRRAQSVKGRLKHDEVLLLAEEIRATSRLLTMDDLQRKTGIPRGRVRRSLERLADIGAIEIGAGRSVSAARRMDPAAAAQEAVGEQERYREHRRARVEFIQAYAETDLCRRKYLLNYFGQETPDACGSCDNCTVGSALRAAETRRQTPFPAQSRVKHAKLGPGTVMRVDSDRLLVLFDDAGPKELLLNFVLENRLLKRVDRSTDRAVGAT